MTDDTTTTTVIVATPSSTTPGGTSAGGSTGAPRLSGLRLSPARFRPDPKQRRKATRKSGTTISYTDSTVATATLTVLRSEPGVRGAHGCTTPPRHAKKHSSRCTRLVTIGRIRHSDTAGINHLHFSGRFGGRALKPGKYVLRIVATYGGATSPVATPPSRSLAEPQAGARSASASAGDPTRSSSPAAPPHGSPQPRSRRRPPSPAPAPAGRRARRAPGRRAARSP
jgi:hypothetical protein